MHIFNTHLSLSHIARQRSVQEIWSQIQSIDKEEPVFFMGDLNAEGHNDEIRFGLSS